MYRPNDINIIEAIGAAIFFWYIIISLTWLADGLVIGNSVKEACGEMQAVRYLTYYQCTPEVPTYTHSRIPFTKPETP